MNAGSIVTAQPTAVTADTSARAALAPDPSAALRVAFDTIRRSRMDGIPILNEALHVDAVGFRRWQGFWLGVLITPWCMNLVLTEADPAAWPQLRVGEKSTQWLPSGRFEFIFGREQLLGAGRRGETLMCSLFSPMFEFANHDGARATALACLDALFDANNVEAADVAVGSAAALKPDERDEVERAGDRGAETATGLVSKRDFLRGKWSARDADTSKTPADVT